MNLTIKIKQVIILIALLTTACYCFSDSIPADYTDDDKVDIADFAAGANKWNEEFVQEDLDRLYFHWLMDATVDPELSVQQVHTDKSRYIPGQRAVITVKCQNAAASSYYGRLSINITRHGQTIHTASQNITIESHANTEKQFTWNTPGEDFQGYLVEAWLSNASCGVSAIDVSSDWKRYPRYGYITEFYSSTTTTRNSDIIDELSNDYHINSLQYYDWAWRHENVIKKDQYGNITDPWYDWRSASISFGKLTDSIAKARARNIAPMPYFQAYIALDNYQIRSGVNPQWGLYSDTNHANQLRHTAGSTNFWLFDPANQNWQNHLCDEFTEAMVTMDWDGLHVDQLGNIAGGNYYDYWGSPVDLEAALASMLDRTKDHLDDLETNYPQLQGRDSLVFNIVDGDIGAWAVDDVLSSKVDVIYSELWNNGTYGGVQNFVKYARTRSGNKSVVLAAYVNSNEDTGGVFDTDSVLLADAAFFASGAFHIELGDGSHMLAREFFPDRSKTMNADLKARLKDYYNFITAYESLLFSPELRFGDRGIQWISIDGYTVSGNAQANSLWQLNRATEAFEVFHLVNLLGNDDQWRNVAAAPPILHDVPVKLRLGPDAVIDGVYVCSPDSNNCMMKSVPYSTASDSVGHYVSIILPQLEYWDMIYVKRKIIAPVDNRYEAEDAIKINVAVNTNHNGYTGAGFVDGFYETGDSVSFHITVPQPGDYTLKFRYGNGGTGATRSLIVNGDSQGQIQFPWTGNWSSWSVSSKQIHLDKGTHQLVLLQTENDHHAINLDNLQIQ